MWKISIGNLTLMLFRPNIIYFRCQPLFKLQINLIKIKTFQYIEPRPGYFIDIDTNKIVGEHIGIHTWTVGQRCRLHSFKKPFFVAKKLERDILVASGTDHSALYSNAVIADSPLWISNNPTISSKKIRCHFRFQHTKPLVSCTIECVNNGNTVLVQLDNNLRAVTPGQYGVFYDDEECLGCVRIIKSFNI